MNVNRILEVQNGNPVIALQAFLAGWWKQQQLEGLLAPLELPDGSSVVPGLVDEPDQLQTVNPFAPLMIRNLAADIAQLLRARPDMRLGILLRPCELRTFVEMIKRQPSLSRSKNLVVIGVDCLGTLSQNEFQCSLADQGLWGITQRTLDNAASGGLQPMGFRTACQICSNPAPQCDDKCADLVVGVIGVNSCQGLLLIARDEETDSRLGLANLAPRMATEYQVSHRDMVVGAIADTRAGFCQKMIEESLSTCRFNDFAYLLAWLAKCTLCGECLRACPLYDGRLKSEMALSQNRTTGQGSALYELVNFSQWLCSCSGCGMCEEACEQHIPLSILLSALNTRICQELNYRPGDPQQQLPWYRENSIVVD